MLEYREILWQTIKSGNSRVGPLRGPRELAERVGAPVEQVREVLKGSVPTKELNTAICHQLRLDATEIMWLLAQQQKTHGRETATADDYVRDGDKKVPAEFDVLWPELNRAQQKKLLSLAREMAEGNTLPL